MKKCIISTVIAILSIASMAQDKKVAVFDPVGSVDTSLKEIVREEISSSIVNIGGFTVLERQLIDKVLEENKFQSGGLVDDSQVSEIGKRMGANLVFVSSITTMGNNLYVSCKMIDVMTARIEKQKTAQTQRGQADLVSVVQGIVREMFANKSQPAETSQQTNKFVVEKTPVMLAAGLLTTDGKKVYSGGKELKIEEVRYLMADNPVAFASYGDAVRKRKNARIWYICSVYVLPVIPAQILSTQSKKLLRESINNYNESISSN